MIAFHDMKNNGSNTSDLCFSSISESENSSGCGRTEGIPGEKKQISNRTQRPS